MTNSDLIGFTPNSVRFLMTFSWSRRRTARPGTRGNGHGQRSDCAGDSRSQPAQEEPVSSPQLRCPVA